MPRARRSFSPQFKAQTILDLLIGVANQAEICRQHKLSPQMVARWKATVLEQLHRLRIFFLAVQGRIHNTPN